jgi:hypothetical protein
MKECPMITKVNHHTMAIVKASLNFYLEYKNIPYRICCIPSKTNILSRSYAMTLFLKYKSAINLQPTWQVYAYIMY